MIAEKEVTRKISISEFKARCTEEIRRVEETGAPIELARHGKPVATVRPPVEKIKSIEDWFGSGADLMKHSPTEDYENFVGPTWKDEDWHASNDA